MAARQCDEVKGRLGRLADEQAVMGKRVEEMSHGQRGMAQRLEEVQRGVKERLEEMGQGQRDMLRQLEEVADEQHEMRRPAAGCAAV